MPRRCWTSIDGGSGFGPRHVDFHPTKPWMYVSMDQNNEVPTFEVQGNGIAPPLFWCGMVSL